MKAVRLLNERGFSGYSIDDVSHVVANLLKNDYTKHPLYDIFISAVVKPQKTSNRQFLPFLLHQKFQQKPDS
jgi:hypothetical protein